jgi:hypothetical protein
VSTNRPGTLFRARERQCSGGGAARQPAGAYFFFEDFFEEDFVEEERFDGDFFVVFFDEVDFFEVDAFFDVVDFFEVEAFFVDDDDFFDAAFFDEPPEDFLDDEDFFAGGTLPPSRRASERPMAMACLRLVTFLPEPPLRSVPSFRSCIVFSTLSWAFLPYLLAMQIPPAQVVVQAAGPAVHRAVIDVGARTSAPRWWTRSVRA